MASRPRAKLCRLRRGHCGKAVLKSCSPVTPGIGEGKLWSCQGDVWVVVLCWVPPLTRPHVIVRCAENAENLEELIDLTLAGEHGPLGDHLNKDGAHRPDVHRRGVRLGTEQNLRRTVPQRHHLHTCRTSKNVKVRVDGVFTARVLLTGKRVRRADNAPRASRDGSEGRTSGQGRSQPA